MAMKGPTSHAPPAVDDHFVREDAGVEVVNGQLVMTPPAEEPHATAHFSLSYVLAAHVTADYKGAVDMLTRTSATSDFAPDASVYPAARDPDTRGRKLEELAFEIASTQPLEDAADKARELVRRGVRRVFCLVIKHKRLLEWSRETDGWSPLPDHAQIDDRCFVRPIPVRALLDATAADASVVEAMIARGHPALRALEEQAEANGRARGEAEGRAEGEARGRAEGLARGRAEALIALLRARGLRVSEQHEALIAAASPERVRLWLDRVLIVGSVDELLGS